MCNLILYEGTSSFVANDLTVTASLSDWNNSPKPDELAGDIVENLEAALLSFRNIVKQLV